MENFVSAAGLVSATSLLVDLDLKDVAEIAGAVVDLEGAGTVDRVTASNSGVADLDLVSAGLGSGVADLVLLSAEGSGVEEATPPKTDPELREDLMRVTEKEEEVEPPNPKADLGVDSAGLEENPPNMFFEAIGLVFFSSVWEAGGEMSS